jgi:hypothetical protein
MKIVIMLALFAIVALQLNTAVARSPAESAPTGELINYPDCGYPQSSFTLLLCDALDG